MSYKYETQYNSPNFTPAAEAMRTWGKPRTIEKIAIHWWGDPNTNPTYEGVIATLCNPSRGASAHFVATGTGRRVACLVNLEDASWATNSANPYTISIECDPRCREEDYDVVAELISQIRSAYGDLPLVPHKQFVATACPGNYNLAELDRRARLKDGSGDWGIVTDKVPVDTRPEWVKNLVKYPTSKTLYAIDDITPLRDLTNTTTIVKNLTKGTPLEIAGETKVGVNTYLLSKYAVSNSKAQGFDTYELQATDPNVVVVPPAPTPLPKTTDEVQNDRIGAVETRLSALEAIVKAITDFLTSIFSGFKKS